MVAATESRKIVTTIVNNDTVKFVAGYASNTYETTKTYLPTFLGSKVSDVEGLILARVGDSNELVNSLDQTVDSAIDYVEAQPAYEVVANKTVLLTDAAETIIEKYLPADEEETEDDNEETKPTLVVPRIANLSGKVSRRTAKKISKGLEDLQLRTKEVVHVDLIAYAQSLDKENYMGKLKDNTVETYEHSKVVLEEKVVVPVKTVYSDWMVDELSGKPSVQKFFSVVGETYDERVSPVVNEYKETAKGYLNENRAVLRQKLNERYEAMHAALMSVFHVLNVQFEDVLARKEVAQAKEYVLSYITLIQDKYATIKLPEIPTGLVNDKYNEIREQALAFYNKALQDERLTSIKSQILAAKDQFLANEYVVKAQTVIEPYYNEAVARLAPAPKAKEE